jgi:hypothetical protein
MINPRKMLFTKNTEVLPPKHPLSSGNAILRGSCLCDTHYSVHLPPSLREFPALTFRLISIKHFRRYCSNTLDDTHIYC